MHRLPDDPPAGPTPGAARAPFVALVDGDPTVRTFVEANVHEALGEDALLLQFATGADALRHFADRMPDVILIGLKLAGRENGLSWLVFLRRLQSDPAFAEIPTVIDTTDGRWRMAEPPPNGDTPPPTLAVVLRHACRRGLESAR
jgi:hypothetical protein